MSSPRPFIGITGPDRGGFPAWFFARRAVRRAGGKPVRITPSRGMPDRPLDGLIVGGGADIEPARYQPGAAPSVRDEMRGRSARSKLRVLASYLLAPLIYAFRWLFSVKRAYVDRSRDELELELLARAMASGAAILGICRGAQLLNVHLGGNLHRDLHDFYVEEANPWTVFPRKRVDIEAGSRLAAALGRTSCTVNSLHRQAVDEVGGGLRISAQEPNGVVQGVELPERPFVLGVQWHPEYLPQRPEQRRLFECLVEAARGRDCTGQEARSGPST